jgi:type VI secretion system protein ImpJ
MKHLSKVVWSEGMYLGPHHFQAQGRYFEDTVQFGISTLWFEPYGLIGCQLDAEALRNGTVALVHARGVFPDGLPFHMPESDPLPEARNIADLFPPTHESLGVMLAISPRVSGGVNCVFSETESHDTVRFIGENQMLHDDNTGGDEKPVRLGRKNIRLLLDTEEPGALLTLPLARVTRDTSGHFIYDERFIPPCLDIAASERLMMLTRRLIEILEEKSATLSRANRNRSGFSGGFSPQEVATFWYLHSINSSLATLRHLYFSKRGHPEELFVELLRLGGALCTFKVDSHPRELPLYDHRDLEKCFEALDEHIRTHLEVIFPQNCVAIPLQPAGKYIYAGEITDQRCLDRARWILGIQSTVGEADLIARTAQLVKVCSSQFVPELVKRALPGLTLTHQPVPPSAVSPRVDHQYFVVNRAGPCWDHIVKTRRVGIYVPGELPNPELELLVLLEA